MTQLAMISTIMPHTNRQAADNYRWALLATAALVLIATLAGLIPVAILAAAFLVPVTYLVYIYDVNLWEDQPVSVIAGLFLFTGVLSILISAVFFHWIFADQLRALGFGTRAGIGIPFGSLVLFTVLLPIVAEIAKNIGPLILASRPAFDDMIDGLTFGIAAGTAYAAFETVIQHWGVFTSGTFRTTDGISTWLVIVLNLMVVKSLIYGTATGIAAAAFSGRGEGYDGFTSSYFMNLLFAVAANVVYWLGVRLLAYLPFGNALGLLWGVLILAVLVIRIRLMLHAALLEAAVEAAQTDSRPKGAVSQGGFCPE
ncbi:MAG: PrsW family glutamic-type intramembrane protease, partial [Actinomycetota bacterium]|nr:PrsW family glutamic-type intramembrane protease [Actinomycetota bacterium]